MLITGASTGLGFALSQHLLETDYRLILTARGSSLARFQERGIEPSDRIRLRALDVTSHDERCALVEEAERDWGGVDVLVNNAGIAIRSVVEHVSEEDRLHQMGVNFLAPMALARLVLPSMRRKQAGRIVNISSVGGMMAMPTMAVYSASKFALEGATEALWYEVRPWGLRVTLIEPGFINSKGFSRTQYTAQSLSSAEREDAAYHRHYESMTGFIERLMGLSPTRPHNIARRIRKVIESRRPPLRVQVTLDAHFFSLLRRLLPRSVYHEVLYRTLPGVRSWGPRSPHDPPE
ncbi:MAG: SDR family oxidoreductase [Acidobacteriota bacterium]